jgi:outer membrane protease
MHDSNSTGIEDLGIWYTYPTWTRPLCPVGRFHIAEIKFNSLKEGINMRVYFTFSRAALVLAVVCMAMGMPAGVYAMDSASVSQQVVVEEPTTPANLLNFTEYFETTDTKAPAEQQAAPAAQGNCNQGCGGCALNSCCYEPCREWYFDGRIQRMYGYTSYQFGTAPGDTSPVAPYAPLSKLNFSLDSDWIGLRVGVRKCDWDIHFEWLTPMTRQIDGFMSDYDWNINNPRNDADRLDSLTHSGERWNDGQKLELEGEFKYSDCILGLPIEVWPLAGFRFQRFDITAFNVDYIIPDRGLVFVGDAITFNQQYYIGYIGAQFRRSIQRECRRPIDLTFQVDYGGVNGYNVDHHLLRTPAPRYTFESTNGDQLHFSLAGDIPLNCHLNLGLQVDYTSIRTTGTHRLTDPATDLSWTNGVLVKSEQTALTAYLQYVW